MKNILIIEDNEDIRENVAEILTLSDYKVLTAANGKEGIEAAQKHKPDLIICDIMMPGVDGYGVLHVLHKTPETQNIPFIFLTSKSERSDFRAAMELGADDYITKPFAGNELLNAIESRFRKMDIMKKSLTPDIAGVNELRQTLDSKKTLEQLTEESNTNVYKKKQLFYNTGDFFGYITLLQGGAYTESAETIEETEVATIPRKDFEDLINSSPATAGKFISLLAKNVADKEQHLLGIAYNTLRKKVAEALVSLQKKYHVNKKEPFLIDISRDDLATIAGTASDSLIRTLSDFKSENLIDIKSGKVIISDEKKLANLIR